MDNIWTTKFVGQLHQSFSSQSAFVEEHVSLVETIFIGLPLQLVTPPKIL